MGRYGDDSGNNAAEAEATIDLGIDTIGKHRIEIRTPQPLRSGMSPSPRPGIPLSPRAGLNISREFNARHQFQVPESGFVLEFDLEFADLSTPRLDDDHFHHSLAAQNRGVIRNTSPQVSGQQSLDPELELVIEMGNMSSHTTPLSWLHRHRQTPATFAPSFDMCVSQLGNAIQWFDPSLPTFFRSTDTISVITNIESSQWLTEVDTRSLAAAIKLREDYEVPWGWLRKHLASFESCLPIPELLIFWIEGTLDQRDTSWLLANTDAQILVQLNGQKVLQLILSVSMHLCCNGLMPSDGLPSLLEWLEQSGHTEQLVLCLRRSPIAARAFTEESCRAFRSFKGRDGKRLHDWCDRLGFIFEQQAVPLSKELAGRLLLQLSETDCVSTAKIMIARGADMNIGCHDPSASVPYSASTPLCRAVYHSRLSMVQCLLEAGCDANRQFTNKNTGKTRTALNIALSIASSKDFKLDDLNIAELLLSWNVDISPELDPDINWKFEGLCIRPLLRDFVAKRKPLITSAVEAAASGNKVLSKFLLKFGILQEEALEYVLSQAVARNDTNAVMTLLQRGVNPNVPQLRLGHRIFGQVGELDETPPIRTAVWEVQIFYLMFKAGANIDGETLTELSDAYLDPFEDEKLQFLTLLQAMIMSGHNPTIIGPLALYLAVEVDSLILCDILLDLGAPINAYAPDAPAAYAPGLPTLNALQKSAYHENLALTRLLLDRGAAVNYQAHQNGGRTALQAALERSNQYNESNSDLVIECLLNAGADVKAPPAEKNGRTTLEAVAESEIQSDAMFKRMLALGAPINRQSDDTSGSVLHSLIRTKKNCLQLALEAGTRVEDRPPRVVGSWGAKHVTPLQFAAVYGKPKAIPLLLAHGANINASAADDRGRTALQAATTRGDINLDVVKLLLSSGASVNAPPARKGGITALQGAAIRGDLHVAKILLDHGADVNAPAAEEEGRTAIEGAAEHGRFDMVRLLLEAGAKPDPERGFAQAIELAEKNNHFLIADVLRESERMSSSANFNFEDLAFGGGVQSLSPQGFILPDAEFENWVNF